MAALGDKIGSTILAQAANVPTIPWSGSGVAINFASCNGIIPPEVYDAVRAPFVQLTSMAYCCLETLEMWHQSTPGSAHRFQDICPFQISIEMSIEELTNEKKLKEHPKAAQ